jgi:hypothetical protein
MRWKEAGAAVVLSLRALVLTPTRWDQFWSKLNQYGFPVASELHQIEVAPISTSGIAWYCGWVMERTVGWLMHGRRRVREYELLPETSETLI